MDLFQQITVVAGCFTAVTGLVKAIMMMVKEIKSKKNEPP